GVVWLDLPLVEYVSGAFSVCAGQYASGADCASTRSVVTSGNRPMPAKSATMIGLCSWNSSKVDSYYSPTPLTSTFREKLILHDNRSPAIKGGQVTRCRGQGIASDRCGAHAPCLL